MSDVDIGGLRGRIVFEDIDEVPKGIDRTVEALEALEEATDAVSAPVDRVADAFADLGQDARALASPVDAAAMSLEDMADPAIASAEAVNDLRDASTEAAAPLEDLSDTMTLLTDAELDAVIAGKDVNEVFEESAAKSGEFIGPLDELGTGFQVLKEKTEATAAALATASQEVEASRGFFGQLHDAISGVGEKTTEFGKGITDFVKNPIDGAKGAIVGALESIGPFGVGLATIGTVAGVTGLALFKLTSNAAAVGGKINDMGEIMSLSSERTSRLKYAMDVAGGSIEKASTSIFMLQRRMADPPKGFEEALERINLSLTELQGMKSDEQLYAISRAFQENTDQTNRAAVAMDLFGRQGRDMIPLLMKDLEGLAAQTALVWSDEDTARAEKFEMASKALGLQVDALWQALGNKLIPVMTVLVEKMTTLLSLSDKLGVAWGYLQKPFDWVNSRLKTADEHLKSLVISAAEASGKTKAQIDAILKGMGLVADKAEAPVAALNDIQSNLEEITKRGMNLSTNLTPEMDVLGMSIDDIHEAFKKSKDSAKDLEQGMQALADKVNAEHWREWTKAEEDANKAAKDLRESLTKLEHGFDFVGASATAFNGIGDKVSVKLRLLKDDVEALQRGGDHLAATLLTMGAKWSGPEWSSIPGSSDEQKTLGSFQSSGIATLAAGLPGIGKDLQAAATHTDDWGRSINEVTGAFADLAQISGSSFGGVIQDIGKVLAAINVMNTAVKATGSAVEGQTSSWGKYAGSATAAISAVTVGYGALMGYINKKNAETDAVNREFTASFTGLVNRVSSLQDSFAIPTEKLKELQAKLDEMFALPSAEFVDLNNIRAASEELDRMISRYERLAGEASRRFGPSKAELEAAVKDAADVLEFMQEAVTTTTDKITGTVVTAAQYTKDQIDAAYFAWQKALADSGDVAAQAWVKAHSDAVGAADAASKAFDDLRTKREGLAASIAGEAPEEVMGIIEAQTRGQMDALDSQIALAANSAEAVITQAMLFASRNTSAGFELAAELLETALATAAGEAKIKIEEALANIRVGAIHIETIIDPPSGGGNGSQPKQQALGTGGIAYAAGPMEFSTKGGEHFWFGGEGGASAPPGVDNSDVIDAIDRMSDGLNTTMTKGMYRSVRDAVKDAMAGA